MKRNFNIIGMLLAVVPAISAQQYYYFRGDQIPLTEKVSNYNSRSVDEDVVYCDQRGMELIPTGYLYVKLKEMADSVELKNFAQESNLQIVNHDEYMPLWYTLQVKNQPNEAALSIANAMFESGDFAAAEPDFSFDALQISYDPDVRKQWNLCNMTSVGNDINISKAWSYASGRGVKIAIIDDGIDVNHVDLKDNIIMTYNCEIPENPIRVGIHGTHCAGIAAATKNNGHLISGVAPDAKIMAAGMFMDYPDDRIPQYFANSINWAWSNGADIISCSWSSVWCEYLADAFDAAIANGRAGKGCVVVCAAGNAIEDEWGNIINNDMTFPATYRKEIIAVGASDIHGLICGYSCVGDNLLVCAPGDSIWSTLPNNTIGIMNGTSMATPHVAGVAALILERNSTLTSEEVREIIARYSRYSSRPNEENREFGRWNPTSGYGIIDAYNIIKHTPKP